MVDEAAARPFSTGLLAPAFYHRPPSSSVAFKNRAALRGLEIQQPYAWSLLAASPNFRSRHGAMHKLWAFTRFVAVAVNVETKPAEASALIMWACLGVTRPAEAAAAQHIIRVAARMAIYAANLGISWRQSLPYQLLGLCFDPRLWCNAAVCGIVGAR